MSFYLSLFCEAVNNAYEGMTGETVIARAKCHVPREFDAYESATASFRVGNYLEASTLSTANIQYLRLVLKRKRNSFLSFADILQQ